MLELDLIRHAQSFANINAHLVHGQSNEVSLTPLGIRQAQALNARLVRENRYYDIIKRSTALRTKMTAEYGLSSQPQFATIEALPELLEIHQGDFVGKLREDVYTKSVLDEIALDPWNFCPPQGESQATVAKRMWQVTNRLTDYYHANGEKSIRIAYVTHGIAIKTWMRELLQFDPNMTWLFEIENTSITQFNYRKIHGKYQWVPMRINDAAHIYGIE